jgi:hypothetical protein
MYAHEDRFLTPYPRHVLALSRICFTHMSTTAWMSEIVVPSPNPQGTDAVGVNLGDRGHVDRRRLDVFTLRGDLQDSAVRLCNRLGR